jgi:glyoxylase-like metal-dependent hydrolase (beta-lactamase superfamily II)
MSAERFYFRQLLAGRDFAVGDPIATQMRNFAYLVGDRDTGDCVVVDPAYAAGDLADIAENDGLKLSGVLVTHHHPDHIGGTMMGFTLRGVRELLEQATVPVHVNDQEKTWVAEVTGIAPSELTGHGHGDKLSVGAFDIEFLHTPGHTPGSQCFLVDDKLIAGDTLFIDGCGRTDFPGGDSDTMFRSLRYLADMPINPEVYPGHWYSQDPHASLDSIRDNNYVLRPRTLGEWHALMPGCSAKTPGTGPRARYPGELRLRRMVRAPSSTGAHRRRYRAGYR